MAIFKRFQVIFQFSQGQFKMHFNNYTSLFAGLFVHVFNAGLQYVFFCIYSLPSCHDKHVWWLLNGIYVHHSVCGLCVYVPRMHWQLLCTFNKSKMLGQQYLTWWRIIRWVKRCIRIHKHTHTYQTAWLWMRNEFCSILSCS